MASFLWNKRLRGLRRYQDIAHALVKYGYIDIVEALRLRQPLRLGQRIFGTSPVSEASKPQRLRMLCEELGPTFTKFGQLLSTRADLLPAEYLSELALLQDSAPHEPFDVMQATMEEAFNKPLDHLFANIDPCPLAAASIAQVHRATLPDGTPVIVKIQRPRISSIIAADLDVLRDLARLAERYMAEIRPLQPVGLVDEFARILYQELDFRHELANLERCSQYFANDPTVLIPKPYPKLTTSRVLTMAYIEGLKVTDRDALVQAGHDPHTVAVRGANALLKQIFVYGFFQGDPHPGNLVVLPNNVIAILDYGMFGILDTETRELLAGLLLGVVQRDARRIVRALIGLDVMEADADRRQLRRDVTQLVDTYLVIPLEQIDLSVMLEETLKIVHRHSLQVPPEFFLLVRALTTAESIGRNLDPDFNIAMYVQPFAEQLVLERYDPRYIMRRLSSTSQDASDLLLILPSTLAQILDRLRRNEMSMGIEVRQLDRLMREIDTVSNRLTLAVILAATIIGSSLIIQTQMPPLLMGYPALGLMGFLISAVLGLGLVIAILRSGGF